ncbi:PKD domain-containing protein [Archaeoglobus veneficus]|uniref:von Willebrand factor type A n=1 Tax=Archaeoglobus veneficus (strain DSM 11195 / SNP6) TaxID=693661 RepID=F2KN48_ARCVS|nr:PKD domain-containing protein [Archaeoglobus veneficus]AEA46149.1 von Willebrand factor type A [Archaeoglobus veneficus SNP6]
MRTRKQSSCKAVSVLIEYILITGILTVFMGFIMLQLNDLLVDTPTSIAMKNQFEDIGNQIATKLVDMALVAPQNGYIKAKIHMPYRIGEYDFKAAFTTVGGNRTLMLTSERLGRTEYIPLSGIALEVFPSGETFSVKPDHELVFSRSFHVLPTAVAVAHPTNATVDQSVTFDMTYSSGEGSLSFKWEFGDGSSTSWLSYDPNNPSTALVQHSYSSSGTYTAKLTVCDSYGYCDTDTINITVNPSTPDPTLYVDKFVVPEVAQPGEPVRITIFLSGEGIAETSRNISIMHVIDVSGSMDPDYYGDNGYTIYKSDYGVATPAKWEGSVYVDDSFQKLAIEAYSENGKDVDLWVKSPDGDFARAQYAIPNGEMYYVTNPVEGNWSIAVVADYPTGYDTVHVDIYKKSGGTWYLVDSHNFTLYAAPQTFTINVPSVENLKIEATPVNGTKELHLWVEDGGLYGPYSSSNGEAYETTNAGGTYTAYVVADFPYGEQEFYLNVYIAKIDAAKIAAKTFNGFLKSSDQVGVAYFGGDVPGGYTPRYDVSQTLTNDTLSANNSIDDLWAYGGTPMGGGIKVARQELVANTAPGNIPVMIVLSDGNPTLTSDGTASETLAIQEAIEEAETTKQTTIGGEQILIYTIGFGNDANETLLKQIATSPDYYYFAATSEELSSIYRQIAKELKEKAAKNVTITDVLPEGVELVAEPSNANVTYDASTGYTTIQWNLSSIRINETWTASFFVTIEKEGITETNVFELSNVTYLPYPFTGVSYNTIYLPVCEVNVTRTEAEKVELK